MKDFITAGFAKQNLQTVGTIRRLSLNLVEKWRRIREANDYANSFYKPKLIAR